MAGDLQLWPWLPAGPWPIPQQTIQAPADVVPPAGDLPPVPVVAHAVELIEARPYRFVEQVLSAAPLETPARPLVVKALDAPPSLPEVFTAAVHAVADVPVEPVLVRAVELPWTPPQVLILRPNAGTVVSTTAPAKSVVVSMAELPWTPPQVLIAKTATADLPDVTLPVPTIAIGAGMVGGASAFVHRVPQPFVASLDTPPSPTVVSAIQPPPANWRLAGTAQAIGVQALATDAPPKPIVVAVQQPAQPLPFIYVSQTETPPPAAAPQVPIPSTVVSAQPVPPQGGTSRVSKGFATAIPPADPQVPPHITVVGPLEPPQPVDQVVLYTVVSDWRPSDPTIVGAGPVPQALPFTEVISGRVDPAAPPPAVPIRPTIVNAQPLPYPVQSPWAVQPKVNPPVLPVVPIQPTVVGQQPIPPQAAFVSTPKGGRWGNPPPNHRIIQPQVNVDMSLPFRPNGWSRVAHGFAEALPLLYEGTIVGGTLEGALVSGGVMTGSAIGGTIQNGYITGGVR